MSEGVSRHMCHTCHVYTDYIGHIQCIRVSLMLLSLKLCYENKKCLLWSNTLQLECWSPEKGKGCEAAETFPIFERLQSVDDVLLGPVC